MKREFIVFDTETNGTSNCSVISVAFIKLQYNFELNKLEKISDYYRFYYREPQESPNYGALKVNGLYDEVIKEKRISADYPLYFKDDIENLKKFIGNCKHFIAHNISFDRNFIPFKLKYQFCTMNENIDIVKISKGNGYKWPKLLELAEFYQVPYDNEKLHDSYYDTLILARIVYKMFKNNKGREKLFYFLSKN